MERTNKGQTPSLLITCFYPPAGQKFTPLNQTKLPQLREFFIYLKINQADKLIVLKSFHQTISLILLETLLI